MKLVRAQRVLRDRLGYLRAKVEIGASAVIVQERDALDLALRMLGWHDTADVASRSYHAASHILPTERRVRARADRGDELLRRVDDLTVSLVRASRVA